MGPGRAGGRAGDGAVHGAAHGGPGRAGDGAAAGAWQRRRASPSWPGRPGGSGPPRSPRLRRPDGGSWPSTAAPTTRPCRTRSAGRAELEKVAADAGPDVVVAEADTRDVAALAAAVAETERRWGGLDAALAVAGVIAGGVPAWEVPADQEQAVLDIDLGGVLNLARVAVPALLRRPEPRHGRFLAVASAAATRGLPMLAAYCAAKAGVAGFIRALAVELRGTGITANAVSPGSTATPILDESARLYGLPSAGSFAPQQPLGRLLDPAEVAAVLAFLAGDGASGMTGAIVPVDGGLAL